MLTVERVEQLPLEKTGIDLVIDCTGYFKTPEKVEPYFQAGVKKVLVSAPVKSGSALNLVYGINHHLYDPLQHHLITAASCTTNCLAPVLKVLHEEIGIQHGSITTIHDVTNTDHCGPPCQGSAPSPFSNEFFDPYDNGLSHSDHLNLS